MIVWDFDRSLPPIYTRWLPPYYEEAGWLDAVLRAWLEELNAIALTYAQLQREAQVATSELYLDRHERELGLPDNSSQPVATRQSIALTRKLRLIGTVGDYLDQIVMTMTGQTTAPTVIIFRPRVIVYHLAAEGWPGDVAFHQTEWRLTYKAGRAGALHELAPHDIYNGLTFAQWDQMGFAARDTLTWDEWDGGLTTPPSPHFDYDAGPVLVTLLG